MSINLQADKMSQPSREIPPELENIITPEAATDLVNSVEEDFGAVPAGVVIYDKRKNDDPYTRLANLIEGLSTKEIAHHCLHDLDFLSQFVMPETSTARWPDLLHAVWAMLVDAIMVLQEYRGEAKFALGIPRGFAKTTLMKLFAILALTFTRHTFIVVVGSVDKNAENIIGDIIRALDSPQYRKAFGDYDSNMIINRQDEKVFYLGGKQIVLKAKGGRTSLRGLNVNNRRPDFILMDDMQNEENAASPTESNSLLTWMISTLLPTRSPDGAMFLYIGNTYAHKGSILQKLIEDPGWVSLTLGAILSDGKSLWPEVHPISSLLSSYRTARKMGKEGEWLAQMMNAMDVSRQKLVDIPRMQRRYYEYFQTDIEGKAIVDFEGNLIEPDPQWKYIMIDPASTKENADDVAVGCGGSIKDTAVLFEVDSARRNPMDTIKDSVLMAIRHNTSMIFVEDVAYQDTLLWWFNYMLDKWKIDYLTIKPIAPGRGSKNSRIMKMFTDVDTDQLIIHPDATIPFKNQTLTFDKLKSTNQDDILDLAHYIGKINMLHRVKLMEAHQESMFRKAEQLRDMRNLVKQPADNIPDF